MDRNASVANFVHMKRRTRGSPEYTLSSAIQMKRETRRQLGAIGGLGVGVTLMWTAGLSGIVPLFIFGVVGTVAGAMLGERLRSERGRDD
jgi:uncharacterized membrane protein